MSGTPISAEDKDKLDAALAKVNQVINGDPRIYSSIYDTRLLVDWDWLRKAETPIPEGPEALRVVTENEQALLATSVYINGTVDSTAFVQVDITDRGMMLNWEHYHPDDHMHQPCFDLDFPVKNIKVMESASGNAHLYLNVPMCWGQVLILLDAFEMAGLLEAGYVKACKEQGMTRVRMPGIAKPPTRWASSENK